MPKATRFSPLLRSLGTPWSPEPRSCSGWAKCLRQMKSGKERTFPRSSLEVGVDRSRESPHKLRHVI